MPVTITLVFNSVLLTPSLRREMCIYSVHVTRHSKMFSPPKEFAMLQIVHGAVLQIILCLDNHVYSTYRDFYHKDYLREIENNFPPINEMKPASF